MIRNIIDADRHARDLLEQKRKEKSNVQHLIADKHDELKAHYRKENEQRIEHERSRMQQELEQQIAYEQQQYEQTLARLQEQYDASCGQWVDMIVKKCLHK